MKTGSFAAPGLIFILLVVGAAPLEGQVCKLSIAGANDARVVMGPVHAECPGSFHSAPFGNWGVTSNFGSKRDGHQFDGWCHNTYYCDNWGNCEVECKDGWYEWNSCTDISRYQQPNCYLYNSSNCTEQASSTGMNVLGTVYVDVPVSCPYDSDEDGFCDVGGCTDVWSVTQASSYMSLYELDWSSSQLIQTMYFGATRVNPHCDPWGCAGAGSEWVTPIFYDSPSWPPRAHAEMATAVIWGAYADPSNLCSYYAQFDRRYACW